MVEILRRHHWLVLFKLLRGYEDDVAREFAMSLMHQTRVSSTSMVKGLLVTITPERTSRITTLPLGLQWRKEEEIEEEEKAETNKI